VVVPEKAPREKALGGTFGTTAQTVTIGGTRPAAGPTRPAGAAAAVPGNARPNAPGATSGNARSGHPGQGLAHRSDRANQRAQNTAKNPHFTGGHPGQGLEHRSERANERAQNTERNPHLIGGEPGTDPNPGGGSGPNPGNGHGGNPGNGNGGHGGNGGATGRGGDFLYFYHPDHLGSTAYVTDESGALYQHLQYFPFGETWIDQRSETQRLPYLFTGKELDEETGLYYFGARYYDPRTSVWVSADPILGDYLNGDRGMGGVYNSVNLGLYAYAHQNPIGFIDPDGNEVVVKDGRVYINPRGEKGGPAPQVDFANTVGARGFSNSADDFHDYDFQDPAASRDTVAVGNAIAKNPTPGNDSEATLQGSLNDVGDLAPFDGDDNYMMSIRIKSPDRGKYTDITVNYTIAGAHTLDEGFVMKFGQIGEGGSVTLRTYGEGDNWKQTDVWKFLWERPLNEAWRGNHREINESLRQNASE
jgi:RHS repeat-associated protein